MTLNQVTFTHSHQQNFGGYIAYFKLLFIGKTSMVKQIAKVFPLLTLKEQLEMVIVLMIKFPFWMFIKPLGKIFSVKTFYKGKYNYNDYSNSFSYKAKKTTLFKIIGIPYFVWFSSTLNHTDIEKISKLDTKYLKIRKEK